MRTLPVLFLLAGVSHAAKVYLNPPQTLPPYLSPRRASLAVSRHLGLDFFEPLGEEDDPIFGALEEQPFVATGPQNALFLSVEETFVKDVLPPNFKSSFRLSKIPSHNVISSLPFKYIERARHVYTVVLSAASTPEWSESLLDLFSFSTEHTSTFLSEMTALSIFIDNGRSVDSFGAFDLTGLQEIASAYGRQSEQYKLAARTVKAAIESALSAPDIHLALLTVPSSPALPLRKRQEPSLGLQQPITSYSSCFTSAGDCTNATDTCSGRGQCVEGTKLGRTCFVCQCEKTTSSTGRTETWVGESCERKDISSPFVLLTGTVIGLIVTVAGSVAVLYSIGNEALPSTLTSTVLSSKKD